MLRLTRIIRDYQEAGSVNSLLALWGFVDDEEVRKAYRVAAENVPGVRRVKDHLRALPPSVGMGV